MNALHHQLKLCYFVPFVIYSRTQNGCSKVAFPFYYTVIIGRNKLKVAKKDDDKVIENDSLVKFMNIQIKCC